MTKPVRYRQWASKASTILSKAEILMAELIDELGVDHHLTDEVDNILVAAQDTVNALRHYGSKSKETP